MNLNLRIVQNIVVVTLLSVVCNYIVYFGFTTNYSKNVFSKDSFSQQYDSGVYRYRVLGKVLLLRVNAFIEGKALEKKTGIRILLQNEQQYSQFYFAFFLLNTFFLILTSTVLVLLLYGNRALIIDKNESILLLFLLPVLTALSQFVITPYDVSSYFAHLLIILVFFKFFDTHYATSLVAICILLFISSLNRESAALSLAFVVLLTWLKQGWSRRSFIAVGMFTVSFLTAYILIRYLLKGTSGLYEEVLLKSNFTWPPNIIGILFWLLCFYLAVSLAVSKENKYIILAYHVLCLPYIIMCIMTGILFEVRLYLPVFLGAVFLSKVDVRGFKIHLTGA